MNYFMIKIVWIIAFVLVSSQIPQPVLACASCGSGGDDPLILYPNESIKDYFGVSQSGRFKNIDPDGSESTAGGPTTKQAMTLATGRSLSPRTFVTFTVPFMKNIRDDNSRSSIGDPSLAGRYSLVLQTLDDPWLPQVQLVYGYKLANARSIHESRDLKTLMDVFGTGFSEIKAGIDIWFGMMRWKPGFSQLFSMPQSRSFDGVNYQPGLIARSTLSLGYNWFETWKMTVGVNREYRRPLRVDGVTQDDSAQLNHSAFVTSDVMVTGVDTVRFSLSRQAALLQNYSTSRSDAISLAYMHSW